MSINFANLQAIYNQHMDSLLASTGLTTKCLLNYGVSKKDICPNCIYDPGLKKSSNKYKTGGPIAFALGQICPYCFGAGWFGEETSEEVYLAIIFDHVKWINPPTNIAIQQSMIQTICHKNYYSKFLKCKTLTVILHEDGSNPNYTLEGDPAAAGLGDNNYITAIWSNT